MSKALIRFIALLVVSCLIPAPAPPAAAVATQALAPSFRSNVFQASPFNEEAMSVASLAFNSFRRALAKAQRMKTSFSRLLNGYTVAVQRPRLRWSQLPALRHAWGEVVGGGSLLDWK